MEQPSSSESAGRSPPLRIALLGRFEVGIGERTSTSLDWRLRKATNLVKILALAPAHQIHRDQIIDLLWPEKSPETASNNLYQSLHVARLVLSKLDPTIRGPDVLRLEHQILSLQHTAGIEVDVDVFERAAERAITSNAIDDLETAIARYSGELLPEDRYEEWTLQRRQALREHYLDVLLALGRRRAARREREAAIAIFSRAIEVDPVSEFAHHSLISLYHQVGQPRRAIRQYDYMRETQATELGSAPGEATRHLVNRIERELRGASAGNARPSEELSTQPVNDADQSGWLLHEGLQAASRFAWEEAVELHTLALEQARQAPERDTSRICDILLALGDAQTRAALDRGVEFGGGHCPSARGNYLQAITLADELDDRIAFARAALGVAGYCPTTTQGDLGGVHLLEQALQRSAGVDDSWHARLLARLAVYFRVLTTGEGRPQPSGSEAEIDRLAEEAVRIARQIGDPHTLGFTLIARNISSWGPDRLEDRLAAVNEAIALAHQVSNYEILSFALHQQIEYGTALGYTSTVGATLGQLDWIANYLRMPFFQWLASIYRAGHAIGAADLNAVEQHVTRAEEIWPRTGTAGWLIFALRREQGHPDDSAARLDINSETLILSPGQHAHRMLLLAEGGRTAEARMLLTMRPVRAYTDLARKHDWLPTMLNVVDAILALDEIDELPILYDTLLPYADQDGFSTNIRWPTGAIAMYLGRIATRLGRWDAAAEHLARAETLHAERGQRLYLLWTACHQAELLILRDAPNDRSRINTLLVETIESATALGLGRLARQARLLRDSIHLSSSLK